MTEQTSSADHERPEDLATPLDQALAADQKEQRAEDNEVIRKDQLATERLTRVMADRER